LSSLLTTTFILQCLPSAIQGATSAKQKLLRQLIPVNYYSC
jgi:hypothetical protein